MSSTDKIPAENPSGIEVPELREEDKFAARMLREAHVYDAEDIHRKIDAYCMDTMQSNAQHGALPFFLATLPFAALFTTFGSPLPLFLWLAAVTIISGLRLFFCAQILAQRASGGCVMDADQHHTTRDTGLLVWFDTFRFFRGR